MTTANPYTQETAKEFDRSPSMINTMIVESKECACEAYVDWFTYDRWQAQGFQVQKGEKATKISTYRPIEKKNKEGKKEKFSIPSKSNVFCRCQVEEKE